MNRSLPPTVRPNPLLWMLFCVLTVGCPGTVADDDVEQVPGVPDDDDTGDDDDDTNGGPPQQCEATCASVFHDDGEPLLATAIPPPSPVSVLLVRSDGLDPDDPVVRGVNHHLDGVGVAYTTVAASKVGAALPDAGAVFVISTYWEPAELDPDAIQLLAEAVAAGTDLLWLGQGLPEELGGVFGLEVVDELSAAEGGLSHVAFTDPTGAALQMPLFDDFLTQVEPAGAEVLATFEPDGPPAATAYRADGAGRAVLLPFGLMHYWGEEREDHAWARAELLTEALALSLSGGAVLVSPFPDGYGGAFLVRFEDLHPGGTRFWLHGDWMDQYERVTARLAQWEIPLNLSVVARYVDPTYAEDHGWDTEGEDRERLHGLLQDSLGHGAELICHGWTHQYGVGEDDYTGVDWEFSDDASGEWEFLPYTEQETRILAARDELTAAFDLEPVVWETPHLDGNEDTYLAATAAGFSWVNESDGFLFPNRWGEYDVMGGVALNVPHTGSYMPNDGCAEYAEQSLTWVMPRLARMRAPFFLYYHNYSLEQEEALYAMAECAAACDLWRPRVSELASWWELREAAVIEAERLEDGALLATVSGHPAGLTLVFRLPDGLEAQEVLVDGAAASFGRFRRFGVEYVQTVLTEAAQSTEIRVSGAPG